uniref:IGF-like family receptor 1 n=1 Tax=Oryzias sinensis TaxID=183150 RepID=A0A8C7XWA3_9TELE
MMGHSTKCLDLATYWDSSTHRCVSCSIKPGYEVTPNCGIDDHGGRHERPFRECASGTFNDGSRADCRPCSLCGPDSSPTRNCSTTADTECPPRPSVAVAHTLTVSSCKHTYSSKVKICFLNSLNLNFKHKLVYVSVDCKVTFVYPFLVTISPVLNNNLLYIYHFSFLMQTHPNLTADLKVPTIPAAVCEFKNVTLSAAMMLVFHHIKSLLCVFFIVIYLTFFFYQG